MAEYSNYETRSPSMRFDGNSIPDDVLASYFGVDPTAFGGMSFHSFGQAGEWLKGHNVSYTTPQGRPNGMTGPQGQQLPNLNIPTLFSTALQDRDKAQKMADEQFGRSQQAIEDFRAGVNSAADTISQKGTESRDFLRGKIDETEQRNVQEIEGVKAQAEENVRKAEEDEERYLRKLDTMLGRTESDLARTKREFQDVTAQKIQNQRRAVDIEFSRNMEMLEESGRGASSTEVQQLKAQYTEQLGMVASRASEAYNDQLLSLNMQQDNQMAQMRTAVSSMTFGAMQMTQGARSEELQSLAGMAGLMASIGQNADQQRAAAETMYLQAETTAQALRVNGMQAVADMIMRNVPVYLPLSGVIAQVLAMKNAQFTGSSWGAIGGGSGSPQFELPPMPQGEEREPKEGEGRRRPPGSYNRFPGLKSDPINKGRGEGQRR